MRESKELTKIGMTPAIYYICWEGDIDADVLDRAVERLSNSGTWVNGWTSFCISREIARYIGEERCPGKTVYGVLACDHNGESWQLPQLEAALSKKFNRQSDGTWILK